jgi:hypothetical protein
VLDELRKHGAIHIASNLLLQVKLPNACLVAPSVARPFLRATPPANPRRPVQHPLRHAEQLISLYVRASIDHHHHNRPALQRPWTDAEKVSGHQRSRFRAWDPRRQRCNQIVCLLRHRILKQCPRGFLQTREPGKKFCAAIAAAMEGRGAVETPVSRHRVTPTVASHPLALEVPYVGRETAEALAKHNPPVPSSSSASILPMRVPIIGGNFTIGSRPANRRAPTPRTAIALASAPEDRWRHNGAKRSTTII